MYVLQWNDQNLALSSMTKSTVPLSLISRVPSRRRSVAQAGGGGGEPARPPLNPPQCPRPLLGIFLVQWPGSEVLCMPGGAWLYTHTVYYISLRYMQSVSAAATMSALIYRHNVRTRLRRGTNRMHIIHIPPVCVNRH